MDASTVPQVLTVQEVAKILRINKTRAYELVQQGVIPSIRLGTHQIRIPSDFMTRMEEKRVG